MAEDKKAAEYTCTRVTPSMVITGDISSSDNILVEGQIFGNISTSSNVTAKNLIVGNIKADSAALDTARVKGNVDLDGTLAVNVNTIIVGDVSANALKLDGKIRGNVNVEESALLTESSLLFGDISAEYVTTQTGARINGCITVRGTNTAKDLESEFDLGDIANKPEGGGF